jgi:predicted RNase H-like HicB family nuclease
MKTYLAIVERGENSYGAYLPDIPGCTAVGGTEAEALAFLQEALVSHIRALREDGETIPEPAHTASHVTLDV